MSFGIIIRGKNQPSQSKRFRPHVNVATGKYHHTKEDYLAEVKRQNLVPYNPEDYKGRKEKEYKVSEDAHYVVQKIKSSGGKSEAWRHFAEEKGFTKKKIEKMRRKGVKYTQGGSQGFSS